jgi:hypothetical protein
MFDWFLTCLFHLRESTSGNPVATTNDANDKIALMDPFAI